MPRSPAQEFTRAGDLEALGNRFACFLHNEKDVKTVESSRPHRLVKGKNNKNTPMHSTGTNVNVVTRAFMACFCLDRKVNCKKCVFCY